MSRNFDLLERSRNMAGGLPQVPTLVAEADAPELPARSAPPGTDDGRLLLRPLRAIQKYWRYSLAFAIAVLVGVVAIVFITKPVYEPVARIEIDPPGNELFSLAGAQGSLSDASAYGETQVKVLQSDQLALAVIRKLGLAQNPEFVPAKKMQSAPEMRDAAQTTVSTTPTEHIALEAFRPRLRVQRDTASWIINVGFKARDPQLAELVTNTIVEQFIKLDGQTRHDAIMQSTAWLSRQLDDIRTRMTRANQALSDFQKSSGITAVDNAQSSFGEQISELNKQLTSAQADRIQLQAFLAKVNAATQDALPQVKADPVVQELAKKLAITRADLQQTQVIYGKNHPKTRELQAQLDELKSELAAQQGTVLSSLKTSYAAANARERLLDSQLQQAKGQVSQMAQYQELKKEVQANEDLYNTLYAKIKEAGITAESKSPNIRWIDRAPFLDSPTSPKRGLAILVAGLAGSLGGIFLAFVLDSIDTRIHTLDDVKTWTGLPSVSLMPAMRDGRGKAMRWNLSRKHDNDAVAHDLFLLHRPHSAESEALRALYTSVRHAPKMHAPQVLLVASALAGEGKTTIAANLAIALSRNGKTCILDADLRKPEVAARFGVPFKSHLVDVLKGSATVEEAIVPISGLPGLCVLGGVMQEDAGDLFTAEKMAEVIGILRQKFDHVVVDSAPILPFADARAISPLVDGVIFVARCGLATHEAVQRSLELLERVHSARVLEVVLNGVGYNAPEYKYHRSAA